MNEGKLTRNIKDEAALMLSRGGQGQVWEDATGCFCMPRVLEIISRGPNIERELVT